MSRTKTPAHLLNSSTQVNQQIVVSGALAFLTAERTLWIGHTWCFTVCCTGQVEAFTITMLLSWIHPRFSQDPPDSMFDWCGCVRCVLYIWLLTSYNISSSCYIIFRQFLASFWIFCCSKEVGVFTSKTAEKTWVTLNVNSWECKADQGLVRTQAGTITTYYSTYCRAFGCAAER